VREGQFPGRQWESMRRAPGGGSKCWCKMEVVGRQTACAGRWWVMAGSFEDNCADDCMKECAIRVVRDDSFRNMLFRR
jgi:hypothetical protein